MPVVKLLFTFHEKENMKSLDFSGKVNKRCASSSCIPFSYNLSCFISPRNKTAHNKEGKLLEIWLYSSFLFF